MGGFFATFLAGTAILIAILNSLNHSYTEERKALKEKTSQAEQINSAFNQAFFNARGYLALGNLDMRKDTENKEEAVRRYVQEFEKLDTTEKDLVVLQNIREFASYYFDEVIPVVFKEYESGGRGEDLAIANSEATRRVVGFKDFLNDYITGLNVELNHRFNAYTTMQSNIILMFIVFMVGILLALLFITRLMLSQAGKPLSELAVAANQIADGKNATIHIDKKRKDEIGVLSKAFQSMAEKVAEKERDLLEQNHTLIEQKEELHAQQEELEKTLKILRDHDAKLSSRNELINGMSRSLNKQEVLDSVVVNMRRVLKADQGVIVLITDFSAAFEGIAVERVSQFIEHLQAGMLAKIASENGPVTVERRSMDEENGFHQGDFFCQDLYLPVFTADKEIAAIMCFTRFGKPFATSDYEDWRAFSKNIGIALDKISLFEQSDRERRLNQSILDTIKEGVLLVDKNGAILQTNGQFCEMFSLKETQLAGMKQYQWGSRMVIYVDDGREFLDYLAKTISGSGKSDAFTFKKKDSGEVIRVYSEAVWQGEERLGTVFVHRDITKEFEVDQMKSEFVSTVSHELRTPLASILGFSELMLHRDIKPERQKKYLSTILNEAKRLTSLINDFLDVQKMEAGKMAYDKKPANLVEILENVAEIYRTTTDKHEIKLNAFCENAIFLGDKEKMEQVFRNLISNAIKYSPDGGTIQLNVLCVHGQIKVEVRDQGIGIPEEAIGKLFTKFYRVDNSDLRKIGGTGLGLAIVQEIIKAHRGDITVSSIPGVETTFTVSLPAIQQQAEDSLTEKEYNPSRYRVAVVEDDPSLASLISQELSESGFLVEHFANGQSALASMEKNPPDALVPDIILEGGELNGWEIMSRMKDRENLKHIPIIISSAIDEKLKGLKLGAQEYLVKPYKPSFLSKTIMQTLLKRDKLGQIYVPGKSDGDQNNQ